MTRGRGGAADGGAPIVLVSGAAGAIGSATMRALHHEGYHPVGFDCTPSCARGEAWSHVQVDVRDEGALEEAISQVRPLGELAHVIGIAGGALPGEPETRSDPTMVDAELFRNSLETNLVGQFLLLRAALPWLRASASTDRSITLTSSVNALSAMGMPAYSAAKAGLIGMMNGLVDPLGSEGIRLNVVAPGTIQTPRTKGIWATKAGHFEQLTHGTALGRIGSTDDVADAFLALLRLRHVTGQVLVVDGGQMVVHR